MMKSLLDGHGASFMEPRELQSSSSSATPTYWVNYTAQYQTVQDTNCVAPVPVIRILCNGTGIAVHTTSDPSIVCDTTTRRVNEYGFRYFECTNACTSSVACSAVYLNIDRNLSDAPFGTIEFSCSGSTLDAVRGSMQIVNTVLATCAAANQRRRLFSVARMGVSCPPLNDDGMIAVGHSAASTTRSIVYDDIYFECINNSKSYPLSDTDNAYICVEGNRCDGAPCSVILTDIYVFADVPYFQDTCVQTTLSDPIPAKTIPSVSSADLAARILYTAKFQVSWALLFTPRTAIGECEIIDPTVTIVCINSDIRFISSIDDSVSCSNTGINIMLCFADADGVGVNQFVSVTYVSTTTVNIVWLVAIGNVSSLKIRSPLIVSMGLVCRNALDLSSPKPVLDSYPVTPRAVATPWKHPSAIPCNLEFTAITQYNMATFLLTVSL
jgi:hypothetical protein